MAKVLENEPQNAKPHADARRPSLRVAVIRTARPKQWAKNVLVFAAPAAAGVLTHGAALGKTLAAFALFCLLASGTYFLNDAFDAKADRQHPTKRFRPIAAGALSVRAGRAIGLALLVVSIAASFAITWRLAVVMAIYIAVQVAYSVYLKHQPIYDLAAVASGFVLRAIAGGLAAGVRVSEWFLIVATFGSLLMVTGKRVAEHAELGDDRGAHRATLDAYSSTFLRTVLGVSAGGAILAYVLWAFSLETARLHHADPIWYQLSIIPVIIALLRYTFLVEGGKGAKPEDLVLGDRSLQLLGIIWAVLFALGVYAG
ncbi:MAG: decaprenyl-phosphate phosphoribosyltransferase [Acidimicrobiaceae bacterium]|nr:decaprenyl-phosphate phosphoribosyltransferase [Acidimicrobiaceae bacterium]